ncbi:GmrSD restriction endonuclease domain-containing protein [Streptomyces adustus]|uniref:GmrSD restriction endonuclease domain-containing protein n=1 Tax=Streptomyces adustus TaxID=1609272 RepID=UPI00371F0DF2
MDFTQAKLTVEHVMPQSAGPEWLAALAQDCADGETPEELHSRLVHTLGNLTLTAVNS